VAALVQAVVVQAVAVQVVVVPVDRAVVVPTRAEWVVLASPVAEWVDRRAAQPVDRAERQARVEIAETPAVPVAAAAVVEAAADGAEISSLFGL
jgi:hypothetical protein